MTDTEKVDCDRCAETVEADETMSVEDGRHVVCQSCYDNDYIGCDDCAETVPDDETTTVDGREVCESCRDNYAFCESCSEWIDPDYMITINYYDSYCESCVSDNYNFCDSCEVYFHVDEYCEGDACQDCDCESPVQKFKIRNDGNDPLGNDERTTISLPAGEVSSEGFEQIVRLIQRYGQTLPAPDADYYSDEWNAWRREQTSWYQLSYRVDEIGGAWQSKEGNFTKRLSRFAYKTFGVKLPPEIVSEVGNIGRAHSNGVDHGVEVTRNLNLSAYDFGHDESCFWQSYYASRCTLKSNGGFGLRSFGDSDRSDGSNVTGRAWVFPLKSVDGTLTPTFETETPDAFVVFNGYGDLHGYTPARIMAHMAGMTYRKVNFYADPIYVNSEAGYLVAPEEIATNYTDGTLTLHTDDHSDLYRRESNDGTICNHFEPCSHAA